MAHLSTVFGKQDRATTRALTWFIMHSFDTVKSSSVDKNASSDKKIIRKKTFIKSLGMAADQIPFPEETKR